MGDDDMRWRIGVFILGLAVSAPVTAQSALETGFEGALRGCEKWLLEPATWSGGLDIFVAQLGLGNKAGWVQSVADEVLPPPEFRVANHYLRINSTPNAGYVLIVSDRVPFCHITGGGGTDLQPAVEAVLASGGFTSRWEKESSQSKGDMVSTAFRSREEPKLEIAISRAQKADERLDRVQLMATAIYDLGR